LTGTLAVIKLTKGRGTFFIIGPPRSPTGPLSFLGKKNKMEAPNLEAIKKYHGWDVCEHRTIRNFCPECKWEVPTFIRRREVPDLKFNRQMELDLTRQLDCDIKI